MQILDYLTMVDASLPPAGMSAAAEVYGRGGGVQFRSADPAGEYFHERVQLSDRAFLFATDASPVGENAYRQVVKDEDGIHIQFRIAGGGVETISELYAVDTPEQSCIVSRYPKSTVIDRTIHEAGRWRYLCLYASPRGLTELLDIEPGNVPRNSQWLAAEQGQGFHSITLPLQSRMAMAVQDVLSCPFRGGNRRAYMRAKALELLSTVIHALETGSENLGRSGVRLSASDVERLACARGLMMEDLESNLTLAELARRVGLNRTKLALGFKEVYGTSVQAYWRDAKLSRARELLMQPNARITEVALSMGYSELSSFTRAFTRKFGYLPREFRKMSR